MCNQNALHKPQYHDNIQKHKSIKCLNPGIHLEAYALENLLGQNIRIPRAVMRKQDELLRSPSNTCELSQVSLVTHKEEAAVWGGAMADWV